MNDKHSDSYGMDEGPTGSDDNNKDLIREQSNDLDEEEDSNKDQTKSKGKRGRKIKYLTDEERIEARHSQQKAYRERKKTEVEELKARIAAVEDALKALQKTLKSIEKDFSRDLVNEQDRNKSR